MKVDILAAASSLCVILLICIYIIVSQASWLLQTRNVKSCIWSKACLFNVPHLCLMQLVSK